MAAEFPQEEPKFSTLSVDTTSRDTLNQNDVTFYSEYNDLTTMNSKTQLDLENLYEVSALVPREGLFNNKTLSNEQPKEMIARWKVGNLDIKTVVNDALLSGRLPLAVLQLHLHRSRDLIADEEPHDTFNEVRDIGRAIAYELFLKVAL